MKLLTTALAVLLIQYTVAAPHPEYLNQQNNQYEQINPQTIPTPKLVLLNGGLHIIEGRGSPIPTPTFLNRGAQVQETPTPTLERGPRSTSTKFALPNGGHHWMGESIPPLIMTEMDKNKRDSIPTAVATQIMTSHVTLTSSDNTRYPEISIPLPRPCLDSESAENSEISTPTIAPTKPLSPLDSSSHSHPYPSSNSSPQPSPPPPPSSPPLPFQQKQQQQHPLPLPLPPPTPASPTITQICTTTLTPLAAPPTPITACSQLITFSSEYGYRLHTVPQAIETVTTYFVAKWEDLEYGVVPTVGVETVVGDVRILGSSVRTVEVATENVVSTRCGGVGSATGVGV